MGKEYQLLPNKIPKFYGNLEMAVGVDVINIFSWHKCIYIYIFVKSILLTFYTQRL